MPRVTETGAIDNVYKLQVMNAEEQSVTYEIEVSGIPGIKIVNSNVVEVASATDRSVPIRVEVPMGSAEAGSNKIRFTVKELHNPAVVVNEKAVFLIPH